MPFHTPLKYSDAEIHYEIFHGIAPENTFFIHGNLASNNWWKPAVELLQAKSPSKNLQGSVVLAEFRGCGKSTPPSSLDDVNMRAFAEQFCTLVRTLDLGSFSVVGHSTGGLIAALMLSQEPKLFQSALLLDPVGMKGITFQPAMIDAFEKMKSDNELLAMVLGSTIHMNDLRNPFFRDVLVKDASHSVRHVGHWVLQALDGLNIECDVRKIQQPVLVLHGEHDQLLPVQDSRDLATALKNGKFEIIPNQGHCTNVESPEVFVKFLQKFWQRDF